MTVSKPPRGSNEPSTVTDLTTRRDGAVVTIADAQELQDITAIIGKLSGGLPVVLPARDEDLAEEIAQDIQRDATNMARTAMKLAALKVRAGHGDWLPMLEQLGVHERAAQRYLGLARFLAALPDESRPRYLGAPITKAAALSQLSSEDLAMAAETGKLDELLAMPKAELAKLVRKERTAALDAITKKETAEGERDKLRHLALNRLNATGLPEFAIIAREESVALVETMIKALDALDAIYQDNLSAPHDEVADAERHAQAAAGTMYWSLMAAHSRAGLLLTQLGERFEAITGGVAFEHQLKPAEVDHAARTFAVITGRLKVQQQNREAVRENAKGGRGRHRKLRDEA